MAIAHNNPLIKGMSGALGESVVYKYYRDRDLVIMANYPSKRVKDSDKQIAQQKRFQAATEYAKKATSIPHINALYKARITPELTSANAVALTDFLKPPVITEVNVLNYTGAPGEIIRVRAWDDFKVMSVSIRIARADGTVIEEGQATLRGKRGLWRMMTTVRNEEVVGTVFTVVAKDMPGNEATCIVKITKAGEMNAVETQHFQMRKGMPVINEKKTSGGEEKGPGLSEETFIQASERREPEGRAPMEPDHP